jgi:C4-dicarboxylate-specific signal transduction histidine kinase
MKIEKEVLQNAVKKLAERAEDCFDRAKIQHASADKQHASAGEQHAIADRQHASADKQDASAQREHSNADKLVTLGVALEADAVELNGEIEMRTTRSSPQPEMPERPAQSRPLR